MISLKVKPNENDVAIPAKAKAEEETSYPYGTSLQLEGNLLEKLGIDPVDLEIGAKTTLEIQVEITALNLRAGSVDSYDQDSIELQVTDIDPEPLITATNEKEEGGALG